MIDVTTTIISELRKTGLKVYSEYFVDSKTPIPCITYRQHDNSALKQGDTMEYSNQVFHVKVWDKDLKSLSEYSSMIDTIMRDMGFIRVNTIDLSVDGIHQRDLKYKALSLEFF